MNTVNQCAIIAGIGAFFLVLSGRRVLPAARSWSWPQVEGTVVNSYVTTTSANLSGRGSGHISYLVVVYKYTVGGKAYESKRWGFDNRHPKYGSRSPTSGKLMWREPELLAAYPVGALSDRVNRVSLLVLGVAILLAAVVGGLITVAVGTARILQLRRAAKKHHAAAAVPPR